MTKTKDILWTHTDLEKATGGTVTGEFSCTGVSIDSRTLQKGDLFIALKGDALDGHNYVDKAFAAGAAAAIISKDHADQFKEHNLIIVEDTTKVLEDLGRFARARTSAKIIAVAGSVGKTSTKEILSILFQSFGKTHASQKSFNNHWGVPFTLSNMPADTDFGIFEVGMNHPGEIIKLTDQVKPDIAIITTIDQEHIEFFDNGLEGICDANAEIFTSMGKDHIAVLNHDNPFYERLETSARAQGIEQIYGFGEDTEANIRLLDCTLHADSSKVTANILGEKVKYKLSIAGKHAIMNSLGALGIVKLCGQDLSKAVKTLEKAEPVIGRGNRYEVFIDLDQPPITVIDDSYNANPASMLAAFKVFEMTKPKGNGRRIAVLGDMLELGKHGPKLHAELANPLLKSQTDLLFCCGPLMDALYQSLPDMWQGSHRNDSKTLSDDLISTIQPGDVILVKGSAGSRMGYIIQALQNLDIRNATTTDKDASNAL